MRKKKIIAVKSRDSTLRGTQGEKGGGARVRGKPFCYHFVTEFDRWVRWLCYAFASGTDSGKDCC